MKVLVTGAASEVARGAIQTLEKAYDLRLLDLKRSDHLSDRERRIGSILDAEFLKEARRDVEDKFRRAVR